jgi:hypothetical protein
MKKMKITIHQDGTQKIEVLGAVGESCVEFTQAMERRLGVPVGGRELKPEFEMTESEVEQDYEVER